MYKIHNTRTSVKAHILLRCIVLCLLWHTSPICAQIEQREIFVKYTDAGILLDGKLDDESWNTANVANNFWQFFPDDTIKAVDSTEIRMLYDDKNLYIGIRAFAKSDKFIANTLRYDYSGIVNDNVTLLFDTYSDGNNAFMFGVNALGVQREVFMHGGGTGFNNFDPSWNVKWRSETIIDHENPSYISEIVIPFSSLKFIKGCTEWRFQAYRVNLQTNEESSWTQVPKKFLIVNLAYFGTMRFEKPLGKSKNVVSIIPSLTTTLNKDYNQGISKSITNIGVDFKVPVSSGLNLDFTINPDFSNVEVDGLINNLTRFEISLPEKRQFFIDNKDLFVNYGEEDVSTPFFTRRIGIVQDKNGKNIENAIIGGLRLSGKLSNDWRIGLLNLQTAEDRQNEVGSFNNSMVSIQHKVFTRSNVGFFIVNKETFKNYEFLDKSEKFNRVAGLDYTLASKNSLWNGKFYIHKSYSPADHKGNYSSSAFLSYNPHNYYFGVGIKKIDEDFQADLGFVPRKGILENNYEISRIFYPKSKIFNSIYLSGFSNFVWNPKKNNILTDRELNINFYTITHSKNHIEFNISNKFVFLDNDFDPGGSGEGSALPSGQAYTYTQYSLGYVSNLAKPISTNSRIVVGQFYNGKILNFETKIAMRFAPKVYISFAVDYNKITLPNPYSQFDLWLFKNKLDISFTKSLFWTTLIQYSSQSKNLGLNSRIQWRFAPLSDVYFIYNHNYKTQPLSNNFSSLNLKLIYWLNTH